LPRFFATSFDDFAIPACIESKDRFRNSEPDSQIPPRRAGVQFRSQRDALGHAKI
jgi:hypothetical protein